MMTRKERLEYCTICKNRKLDIRKGLLCGLTNEFADFESSCRDYEEDIDERERRFINDLNATGHPEASSSLNPRKNKENGALIFIIGIIVLLLSLSMDSFGILVVPVGAILYGARTYLKGVEQEKVIARNIEFEEKQRKS